MQNNLECPVDFIQVNENKVRMTALLVLLLAVIYFATGNWIIVAYLVTDFFLRGFNFGKYSLLAMLGGKLVTYLGIKNKPVDQAPKRFAARVGLVFTLSITVSHLLHFETAALALTGVLSLFAFLESFAGFCAGCLVYTFYGNLSRKNIRQKI